MSIYATLWWLKFPRCGDDYVGCESIRVTAQGVPAHVGTLTLGFGYEDKAIRTPNSCQPEWAAEHRDELLEDWNLCSRMQTPKAIEPLK